MESGSKFATHVDPDEYKAWLFRRAARPGSAGSGRHRQHGRPRRRQPGRQRGGEPRLGRRRRRGRPRRPPRPRPARPCGPDDIRLSGCCVPLAPSDTPPLASAVAAPAPAGPPVRDRAPPLSDAPALGPGRATAAGAPGPRLSYAELVELIREGRPVPGVREVPDTVLAGQGTASVAARRAKPWEAGRPSSDGGRRGRAHGGRRLGRPSSRGAGSVVKEGLGRMKQFVRFLGRFRGVGKARRYAAT